MKFYNWKKNIEHGKNSRESKIILINNDDSCENEFFESVSQLNIN
jgi:hypothetical protein